MHGHKYIALLITNILAVTYLLKGFKNRITKYTKGTFLLSHQAGIKTVNSFAQAFRVYIRMSTTLL